MPRSRRTSAGRSASSPTSRTPAGPSSATGARSPGPSTTCRPVWSGSSGARVGDGGGRTQGYSPGPPAPGSRRVERTGRTETPQRNVIMDPQRGRSLFAPDDEEFRRLHRCWLWLVVLGVGIMVAGFAAVAYSFAATLTTVLLFGVLLLVGGAIQIANAFLVRSWRGVFISALVGVLHVLVGLIMVEHPL